MAFGKGRSVGQNVKLLYIRDFLYKYTDKNHGITAAAAKKHLEQYGIREDRKTFYTDIERLKYDFGVPVEYNPKLHGFHITKPQFEPYELRMMVDSIQAAKFIPQGKAQEITNKIKDLADIYTRKTLNHLAYVPERVHSMNDSVLKDTDKIHQAIEDKKKIGFRYFHYAPNKEKRFSKNGKFYIVSPFALAWNNGNFYLYAYDGNKFRYFRVDRMERIVIEKEDREGEKDYTEKNIITQQAKVFDMYNGRAENVRLRCLNTLADAVIDQFGKDKVIMVPDDDTHFIVNVPVEISPPFFAWIATFGRRIKILGPDSVVKEMREFLQKSMDMYKNDGEM